MNNQALMTASDFEEEQQNLLEELSSDIYNNNFESFSQKVINLSDLNKKGEYGTRLLPYAVYLSRQEFMELLLDLGADPNLGNPLYNAARNRNLKAVQLLIDKGAKINEKASAGTALQIAAKNNYTEIVKLLLEKGADPNVASDCNHAHYYLYEFCGIKAIYLASIYGHNEVVQFLIEHGADTNSNIESPAGLSALHVAIIENHLDTAQILLDNGAMLNVYTLFAAIKKGKDLEVINFILDHLLDSNTEKYNLVSMDLYQAFVNLPSSFYENPLSHLPIKSLTEAKVEELSDINVRDIYQNTVLHWAVFSNRIDIVKFLLIRGVDISAQNIFGYTAAHLAAYFNNQEILSFLNENNANISIYNLYCETVIDLQETQTSKAVNSYILNNENPQCDKVQNFEDAAHRSDIDIIKLYLANGVDLKEIMLLKNDISEEIANALDEYIADPFKYIMQNNNYAFLALEGLRNLKNQEFYNKERIDEVISCLDRNKHTLSDDLNLFCQDYYENLMSIEVAVFDDGISAYDYARFWDSYSILL